MRSAVSPDFLVCVPLLDLLSAVVALSRRLEPLSLTVFPVLPYLGGLLVASAPMVLGNDRDGARAAA